MAGQAQNLEKGVQGGTIVFDASFREYAGGPLIDTDALPTVTIKRPDTTTEISGSATKVSIGYYTYTFNVPLTAQISALWTVEWAATINGAAVPSNTETFEILATGYLDFGPDLSVVTISDNYLTKIKGALGAPNIDSLLLTDDQVKSECISGPLEQYFTKFPLRYKVEYPMGSSDLEIPFPTTMNNSNHLVYGVLGVNFIPNQSGSSDNFFGIISYQSQFSTYGKQLGLNESVAAKMLERQTYASLSKNAALYRSVDMLNHVVNISSERSGKVVVIWAVRSLDFNDVRLAHRQDVIDLSKAKLLDNFVDTMGIQTNSNLEVDVNTGDLQDKAETLRTDVMDKWEQIPDPTLVGA